MEFDTKYCGKSLNYSHLEFKLPLSPLFQFSDNVLYVGPEHLFLIVYIQKDPKYNTFQKFSYFPGWIKIP